MQTTPPAPAVPPSPPSPNAADAAAALSAQLRAMVDAQNAGQAAELARRAAERAVPRTAQDIAGLRQQREWLSDQLTSAQSRRRDVARALESARDPVNQSGLQQRLQVLDRRILQLETDMAETGRLLTGAPPTLVASVPRPDRPFVPFERGPAPSVVAIVFFLSVLLPLAIATAKRIGRGGRGAPADRAQQHEVLARLARVEQAIEAVAIEVERVSEGQRFVTRVLADPRAAPAYAGDANAADPRRRANG